MSLFDANPHLLKNLLGQIYSLDAALPDFQRDFVWEPSATQELIVSIASNYPAGSLLRIQNTHRLFAAREFQGAPKLNGHHATYLVLDGQQRLTSLYQAFYGVGDHCYYLRLQDLLDGRDFDECLFYLRANTKRALDYRSLEIQAKNLILPLSVMKDGLGGFFIWLMKVAALAPTSEQGKIQSDLTTVAERWIKVIDGYSFPVVTLSDETNADAVCTIFETLNRTGVKLTVYELLTARFWPQGINLRDLWTKARDDHPIIADFDIDPYYLLQTVSLVARSAPSCKRSDVLKLDPTAIEQWWDRAAWGLATGLELLQQNCGIITPNLLPYNTAVIPLAAVLAKLEQTKGPQVAATMHKLTQWFWCAVFGQAYEQSPNSQAVKDMTELLQWIGGGESPDTVQLFRFDPDMLRDATVRQRAIYRGVIALILSRNPRDFYTGTPLTSHLIAQHNVDDHHIFPQAYLKKQNTSERLRDCVLNRTLIGSKTNIMISDQAPSFYLEVIKTTLGAEKFQELLHSHLLPADPDSPLFHNDFEGFLTWRQEAIWKEIQRVTGVAGPTDLISEESVGK